MEKNVAKIVVGVVAGLAAVRAAPRLGRADPELCHARYRHERCFG